MNASTIQHIMQFSAGLLALTGVLLLFYRKKSRRPPGLQLRYACAACGGLGCADRPRGRGRQLPFGRGRLGRPAFEEFDYTS